MKKYVVIGIVVIVVSAYWLFDLDQCLTMEGIDTAQAQLAGWRNGPPFLAGFAFFALYLAVTSLSLPGAAALTLASGAFYLFTLLDRNLIVIGGGAATQAQFLALFKDSLGLGKTDADSLAAGKLPITFLDYDWKLNSRN